MIISIQYLDNYAGDSLFYAHDGDAGFDLRAAVHDDQMILLPRERALIPCGFKIAIPVGYYGRIAPRSGLAVKNGIDVLAGVVDSGYRGEVHVALINLGTEPFVIKPGDRLAQMLVCPVAQPSLRAVDDLDSTGRGSGGFGSTGVA